MQALLGKIIEVKSNETRYAITFEPLCTLPDRKAPPEHLKGEKLTIEREVPDAREIGERGDSIVLTVDESFVFLYPLRTRNPPKRGVKPKVMWLELFWWKDGSPPDWIVNINGKTASGSWERSNGKTWRVKIMMEELGILNHQPSKAVFTCGDLRTEYSFLPARFPFAMKRSTLNDEVFYVENCWLCVEVTARNGGALAQLTGSVRAGSNGLHFYNFTSNFIQPPLDWSGHVDRFRTGWGEWNTMRDKTLSSCGATRENGASRVTMEGEIEDDLRTSFSATLIDDWPLLLMRRDFFLHEKKDDKKDDLQQPIDNMRLFQTGFRCAVKPNKESRVWCCENGEAISFRLAREHEGEQFWHWTMQDGWALFSHAENSHLLYFFDAQAAPHLGLWRGPHTMTLEPFWPGVPLKIGESTGFTSGLAAGEIGGANENGAWVACRTLQQGEWQCALIGRFKDAQRKAIFRVGEQEVEASLTAMLLPGLGTVHVATARLSEDGEKNIFTVHVTGKEAHEPV